MGTGVSPLSPEIPREIPAPLPLPPALRPNSRGSGLGKGALGDTRSRARGDVPPGRAQRDTETQGQTLTPPVPGKGLKGRRGTGMR